MIRIIESRTMHDLLCGGYGVNALKFNPENMVADLGV
jgi:hypothetical protein